MMHEQVSIEGLVFPLTMFLGAVNGTLEGTMVEDLMRRIRTRQWGGNRC